MINRKITFSELQQHNTESSLWVAIHGSVYDLTTFAKEHPGGYNIIFNVAGTNGTSKYSVVHSKDILKLLPDSAYVGEFDVASEVKSNGAAIVSPQQESDTLSKPSIDSMLNLFDIEAVAYKAMTKEGWGYYASAADDEISLRENHAAFHRIWFRPRVLVDVSHIDLTSTILGHRVSMPLYISAAAMGRLAHPDGEVAFTRAANTRGIIQMCPTLGSCSIDEMIDAKQPDQTIFFQLYVNKDRKKTEDLVRKAERGCKALCVTVDAPSLGRRERDMRNKFQSALPDVQQNSNIKRGKGVAQTISAWIDPSLNWNDIAWLKSITKMPLVLKGIQRGDDAIMAAKHGVKAIILSNHGGRQLDFARSAIEILPEVMDALRSIGAEKSMEVWIDGGIRRGTDILKALALGAKAVGIGRPSLFGLAAYGQEGVEKVIDILHEELKLGMSLVGAKTIDDLSPDLLHYKNLSDHFANQPTDFLSQIGYSALATPYSKL